MAWKTTDLSTANDDSQNVGKNWNKLLANVMWNASKSYVYGTIWQPCSYVNNWGSTTTKSISGLDHVAFMVGYQFNTDNTANIQWAICNQQTYDEIDNGFQLRRGSGGDWINYWNSQNEINYNAAYGQWWTNAGYFSNRNTSGTRANGAWTVVAITPTNGTGTHWFPSFIGHSYSIATHNTANTADFTVNKSPATSWIQNWQSWDLAWWLNVGNGPTTIDVSILYDRSKLPAGIKANEPFAKMVSRATLWLTLGSYKYRWLETATRDMRVEIYQGEMPADPDAPVEGTLLCTFSGLFTGHFSTPDGNGVFYLSNPYSGTVTTSGEANYAKILGCYSSTGVKPALYVPISSLYSQNVVTLSKTTGLVAGDTIYLTELGFRFKVGT